MQFIQAVKAEFAKAPVATVSAPAGVAAGVGAIIFAWLQAKEPPKLAGAIIEASKKGPSALDRLPNGSIALLVIAVFFVLTISMAGVTRILYKVTRFTALIASVALAAVSIFLNRLNALILGYQSATQVQLSALDDLMFYGTVMLFLAVAGRAPIIDWAKPSKPPTPEKPYTTEDAIGTLGGIAIIIAIWGALVGWAQQRMITAFLP
ncbi:hypothetical protein [Sphingomonas sp. CFBP 8760]|uniref:hypothetical protein n=1 Tax=Sphingomonas sp. CFBP 8760 TaxID=2775282 RepID=UPI001A90F713|nr:hypothetical protein [Sphingomonas sp. CFBP 8760]